MAALVIAFILFCRLEKELPGNTIMSSLTEFQGMGLVLLSVEAGTIPILQMETQVLPYQMFSKLDQQRENYCK